MLGLLLGAAAAPLCAQGIQLPPNFGSGGIYREDPASALARYLRILTVSPRNLEALTGAGRAALDVGDAQAAIGFYARAEEIAPRNGRIKAGLASALVLMQQPQAALRYFDDATDLGVPEADVASDRGLAYDLRGSSKRAQRDYAVALRRGADDETTRRLALSMAITGDRAGALALLDPLLRKYDTAAYRARAFVLAMTGDGSGAARAAESAMPASTAAGFAPFFRKLPTLRPGEKAAAVHFGHFPGEGRPMRIDDLFNQAEVAARVALENSPRGATDAGRIDGTQVALGRVADAEGQIAATPPAQRPRTEPYLAPRPPAPRPVSPPPLAVASANVALPMPTSRSPAPAVTVVPSPKPANSAPLANAPLPTPAPATSGPAATRPAMKLPGATVAPAQSSTSTPPRPSAATAAPVAVATATPVPAPAPQPIVRSVELAPSRLADLNAIIRDSSQAPASTPTPTPTSAPAPTPAPTAAAPTPASVDAVLKIEQIASAPASGAATPPPPTSVTAAPPKSGPKVETPASVPPPKPEPKVEVSATAAPPAPQPKVETAVSAVPAAPRPKVETPAKQGATASPAAATPAASAGADASRAWVQIAGGSDTNAFPFEWRRLKAKAPELLSAQTAWTTPLKATNRLLVGPFANEAEAQEFVNKLAPKGIAAFAWTSPQGQAIAKLAAK